MVRPQRYRLNTVWAADIPARKLHDVHLVAVFLSLLVLSEFRAKSAGMQHPINVDVYAVV